MDMSAWRRKLVNKVALCNANFLHENKPGLRPGHTLTPAISCSLHPNRALSNPPNLLAHRPPHPRRHKFLKALEHFLVVLVPPPPLHSITPATISARFHFTMAEQVAAIPPLHNTMGALFIGALLTMGYVHSITHAGTCQASLIYSRQPLGSGECADVLLFREVPEGRLEDQAVGASLSVPPPAFADAN